MLIIITIITTVIITSTFFILNFSLSKKNRRKIHFSGNDEPQGNTELRDTEKHLKRKPNDIFAMLRLSYLYFQREDFVKALEP